MTPTICRSFWGYGQLSFFKSERDIVHALNCRRPEGRVYVYGNQAVHFLSLCGIEHHELPDKIPTCYLGGDKPAASMWWHKLVAIRQCLIDTAGPVIHLDWDTEITGAIPDDMIKGPAFQGRLRWYNRPQCSHRPKGASKRNVYHGGCMYFRDVETVERVIDLHAAFSRQFADEAAVTQLADEICGSYEADCHRIAGIDNPAFYRTGRDVIDCKDIQPAFTEGPRFSQETAIPYLSGLIAAMLGKREAQPIPAYRKRALPAKGDAHGIASVCPRKKI